MLTSISYSEGKMYVPLAMSKKTEIETAIRRVQERAGPDVVRIRYEIDKDWSGEWAIFFRIILTDEAARLRLGEIANKVTEELHRELDFDVMGVYSYRNFRSISEQAARQEPAWA